MAGPPPDRLDRPQLAELQRERLRAMLAEVLPRNPFCARKFAGAGLSATDVTTPADLARLPFTTKAELIADQETNPPYGSVLTYAVGRYFRLHQTSGTTTGRPMRWLDTPESWRWHHDLWETQFRVVGLRPGDRLFFPFSFGPFLGWWAAFDAASKLGYFCLPGGGMSSSGRLRFLFDNQATVLLCTPTYALRLAEVAAEEGVRLAGSSVRLLIVAGEPGGSIPATRGRIEAAFGARVFDHSGMTEAGPLGIECPENPAGLHLLEADCIVEVIDPPTGKPVPAGELGELVLTNLGRWGSPVIRYRSGDLVRVDPRPCPCGRALVRLEGGILGRSDDMIHVRGNNLYPGAVEAVVRRFAEVAEYRVEIDAGAALAELRIEVEPVPGCPGDELAQRVGKAVRDELFFRAEVKAVPPGALPRFELKARRFNIKK